MSFNVEKYLDTLNQTSVASPAAGALRVFGKTDMELYLKDENGVETCLSDVSFLDLNDTPAAYTGMAASGVRVDTGGTALEFFDLDSIISDSSSIDSIRDKINGTLVASDGSVAAVVVVDGGTGYVNPTITFSAPPAGGVTATGTATVAGGVITSINITNSGSGYEPDYDSSDANPNPTITIVDAAGTGAYAICYVTNPLPIGVGAHYNSMMCVMRDNSVKAWGYDGDGRLGIGSGGGYAQFPRNPGFNLENSDQAAPDIVALATAYYSSFLLSSTGEVWSVGQNGYGELGDGTTTAFSKYFRRINSSYFGSSPVVKIKTSPADATTFVYALTAEGKCYRWGYNGNYNLGTGVTTTVTTPREMILPFHKVMTSNNTYAPQVSSASSENGGNNAWYAFDRAVDTASGMGWMSTSGDIIGAWLKLDLGAGQDKVVTEYSLWSPNSSTTRMVKDWRLQGSNDDAAWTTIGTETGETGWAASEERQYTATNTTSYRYYRILVDANDGDANYVAINELALYEDIATRDKITDFAFPGADYYAGVMFITENKDVWVCGYNGYGQLSVGHTNSVRIPVRMQTAFGENYVTSADRIKGAGSRSYGISYVLLASGQMYAAGYNGSGYLCNGGTTSTLNGYVNTIDTAAATPLTGVTMFWTAPGDGVDGSTTHVFAKSGSNVYCWGYNNNGQLGMGTTTTYTYAQNNTNLEALFVGSSLKKMDLYSYRNSAMSAALLEDGRIYCAGYGYHGQFGSGDATQHTTWVKSVIPVRDITDIYFTNKCVHLGNDFIALDSTGTMWICGYAGWYGLGDGQSSYDSLTFKPVRL